MSELLTGALRRHEDKNWGPKPDLPPDAATAVERAAAAVARIDTWGKRGLTDVSIQQIEAMAMVIAASGAIGILRARMAASVTETTKGEVT